MMRFLLISAAIVGLCVMVTQSSMTFNNCGGNSAALAQMRSISLSVCIEMGESPGHTFQFSNAPKQTQEILRRCARDHWIRKARFLVLTTRIREDEGKSPKLIAVCDTPYTNVPQRRFWSSPPTHAAGYSDGSTRLLTIEEFAALPKGQFVPLDDLFPPEMEARASVP